MIVRPMLQTILVLIVFAASAEMRSQNATPFTMKVSVNEVELTLHAVDASGAPVRDLQADELRIIDNGAATAHIVSFQAMRDLPIRAAILVDTSSSMATSLEAIHSIATTYAQRVLESKTDQALVMSFNSRVQLRQGWSNDPAALTRAIHRSGTYPSSTAVYDSLYSVCRYQFGALPHDSTGNFIMLFSDGEDDASFMTLQAAVDMCQQTNTAIYAFRPDSAFAGLRNLSQLANLTGGHVFRTGALESEIREDLEIIQANLRNQYRLIYTPAAMVHDGAFHQVVILPPDRVASLKSRSGYYAPSR